MTRIKLLLLSISFGVLMWLAWTPRPLAPLLLVAFVPLLIVEEALSKKHTHAGTKVFGYSYLAFLVWNVLTTWWVGNTPAPSSGVFANTANALLMCFPFLFFHFTKKRLGNTIGYLSLPAYWIAFELLHLRWELTWPWLTLGNGFAQYPIMVQWYEYTGVLGGSLWVLAVNILLFRLFFSSTENSNGSTKSRTREVISVTLLIMLPLIFSFILYNSYSNKTTNERSIVKKIVVVQPNIDPYNEKFDFSTLDDQLNTLLKLSASKIDSTTDYLVWPETAIPQPIWLNDLQTDRTIFKIRTFLKKYPGLKLVTGIAAYRHYSSDETSTARKDNEGGYYDAFNSAIQIDSSAQIPVYHKSKLVPGVERMPYPAIFGFLERFTINMGGISGSLATQEHRTVFFSADSFGVAPVICYESIYGDYCTEYVRRGANCFFIVTNDGWWGNTAGHLQHLHYASLLAIETRRPIARSANTGTSCFIDETGQISQATEWWKPAVIQSSLRKDTRLTFYVRYGDYIGWISAWASLVFFIGMVVKRFTQRGHLIPRGADD